MRAHAVSGSTLVVLELALVLAVVLGFGFRELYLLRRDRLAERRSRERDPDD